MTWLAVYAQHGSCSYGELSAERLREILLGDAPAPDERASVRQALLEIDAVALNCAPAQELANELGLTLAQLDARCVDLTGHTLGSASHTELARQTANP
ncbi:hypothetical protein [Ralstonia pseudosolanacearum]|uniref:hypothetical protein n=1 Tax=Ralstonia pseudosolanacearum TaxID=1310165 RepID=UPI003CECB8EC